MKLIGFDFGTTNSLVAHIQGVEAISFLDEEDRPTPSVVCYEGEQKILGRAAKKRLSQAGLGIQGNIVKSPKKSLGQPSIFVGGIEKRPAEIVADIVEHILEEALSNSRSDGLKDISGAVVTIPINMPGYVRQALRDSFSLAGLRIFQFVHEPFAALYGFFRKDLEKMMRRYDKKIVLVVDWGGGTLDLTLCQMRQGELFQLKNDGTEEVGGDIFDEAILNFVLQKFCNEKGIDAPNENSGARARLFDTCERAKIDLSSRTTTVIYVSEFFRNLDDNDFNYSLNREELDNIALPLINKAFRRIVGILDGAGYSTEQVALCLMTGGMANMPAIKSRIHELFGPARTVVPQNTATLVAEGAAWIAQDRNGLILAKTVELEQARGSFLPLIKAGTAMPKEGQVCKDTFHLYCTDPRDGIAKFQFCTPCRFGSVMLSEPRKALADMTIRVDTKARVFHERLELDVQINDNLILAMQAASLNVHDKDSCEIHELEFGLSFPMGSAEFFSLDNEPTNKAESQPREIGAIRVRSNIADHDDQSLVPGELLYTYKPSCFDERLRGLPFSASEEQRREKLYYTPCSRCGRRSNDPACRHIAPASNATP